MYNPSIESHFAVCYSASFSSQLSIEMKKNKLLKEEKFKVQKGIKYNEENKLFKVQKKCVFLILHKWSCSFYTGYHHSGSVATHALGHMMYGWWAQSTHGCTVGGHMMYGWWA